MAAVKQCENCRFWDRDNASKAIAFCNRYPPTLVVFSAVIGVRGNEQAVEVWPETGADEWCGEWQPLETDS